jgi:dTDP-4-dehydrorhamnose reductase
MRERPELKIVSDQIGAPTWCRDLAEATAQILSQLVSPLHGLMVDEPWGIYHMTNSGETSWHGFAEAIQALDEFDETCAPAHLLPIPGSDYPTPAQRPLNSRLNNDRLEQTFGLRLQDWRTALALCVNQS